MGILFETLLAACLLAVGNADQTYPGTESRPILNAAEAGTLSESAYLQGWSVPSITIPATPDYIVGTGQTYTDIQAAVNAALKAGGTTRKYIEIQPGTYNQTVFIRSHHTPITLYGSGSSPSDVLISLNQKASLSVSDWITQVNQGGSRYAEGDPAYSLYNQCARRNGTIGTTCTSILWIRAPNCQIYNLEVYNTNADSGDAQAVAVKIDADQVRLSNVRLVSRQDTLYSGPGRIGEVQRVYVDNSYIEGDVDFVFGGASTVFSNTTFNAVSDRHPSSAIIFAPNTAYNNSFGFLVENSVLTADATFQSTKKVSLARSWDSGVPSGAYLADQSPNGQVLIRNSEINGILNTTAPYTTSTSSRTYSGDVSTTRNLDDNNYNRFWEYQNTGDGA